MATLVFKVICDEGTDKAATICFPLRGAYECNRHLTHLISSESDLV